MLEELYDILENLREVWKDKKLIPKGMVFHLLGIIPALYTDYPLYADNEKFEDYDDIIYNLNAAMIMIVNSDTNSSSFNKLR